MNTMPWSTQGACKSSPVALSDFFAATPSDEVIATCEGCPVKNRCYDYALLNESYGYWGGSTEQERYATRIVLGIPHPSNATFFAAVAQKEDNPIDHGTARGYQQHRRKKIPLSEGCGCIEAHRAMVRDHRASKKEMQKSC